MFTMYYNLLNNSPILYHSLFQNMFLSLPLILENSIVYIQTSINCQQFVVSVNIVNYPLKC